MQDKTVFQRYEKKYLMDQAQYKALRSRLSGRIKTDRYGLHTICNLYYDTENYDLIRTSLDKPVYKEKLRLRSYGIPAPGDKVFLEIKKKYEGIVYKRRVPIPLSAAGDYIASGAGPGEAGQILREIDWFIRFYHPFPRVFIAYDRIACYAVSDPELRLTFDQNIRYRTDELDLAAGDHGFPVTEGNPVLLEIKIAESMPLWLCHILNELNIYPVSFSKYGVCYLGCLTDKAVPEPVLSGCCDYITDIAS